LTDFSGFIAKKFPSLTKILLEREQNIYVSESEFTEFKDFQNEMNPLLAQDVH